MSTVWFRVLGRGHRGWAEMWSLGVDNRPGEGRHSDSTQEHMKLRTVRFSSLQQGKQEVVPKGNQRRSEKWLVTGRVHFPVAPQIKTQTVGFLLLSEDGD